jgi:hypothetical protein
VIKTRNKMDVDDMNTFAIAEIAMVRGAQT